MPGSRVGAFGPRLGEHRQPFPSLGTGLHILQYLADVIHELLDTFFSQRRTELTKTKNMARYRYNISLSTGLVRRGSMAKYAQSYSKVIWHSFIQEKSLICLKILKKGRYLLPNLATNLQSATICLSMHCTSFQVLNGGIPR